MSQLGWRQAELASGAWMRAAGFRDVVVTVESGDGGMDVIATDAIAQVKARNATLADLREFIGVAQANQGTPLFFTTGIYEEEARDYARGHPGLELFQLRPDGEVIAANRSAAKRIADLAEQAHALELFAEELRTRGLIEDDDFQLPVETPHEYIAGRLDGKAIGSAELRRYFSDSAGRDVIVFSAGGFTKPARKDYAHLATLAAFEVCSGKVAYELPGLILDGQWSESDAVRPVQASEPIAAYEPVTHRDTPEPWATTPATGPPGRRPQPGGAATGAATIATPNRTPLVIGLGLALAIGIAFAVTSGSGDRDAPAQFIDKDCADFATQSEAQRVFDDAGPGDPHRMDRDGDGRVCELLP